MKIKYRYTDKLFILKKIDEFIFISRERVYRKINYNSYIFTVKVNDS